MVTWLYWGLCTLGIIMSIVRRRATVWWVAFYATAIYGVPLALGIDLLGLPLSAVATWATLLVMAVTLLLAVFVQADDTAENVPTPPAGLLSTSLALSGVALAVLLAIHGPSVFF